MPLKSIARGNKLTLSIFLNKTGIFGHNFGVAQGNVR